MTDELQQAARLEALMRRLRRARRHGCCIICGQPALRLAHGGVTATCGRAECATAWLLPGGARAAQSEAPVGSLAEALD